MEMVLGYVDAYGAMALLILFALFVVIGLLVGWRRGWKRGAIRFATLLVFIGGLLLLTPLIGQAIYNMPFEFWGRTISGWAEYGIEQLTGEYWATVSTAMVEMEILGNFLFGIVFAVFNLVLFFVLYFLVKGISLIVYSIISAFAAPKYKKVEIQYEHKGQMKTKTEKEKTKRTKADLFGGMAIGVLTGAMLFFFVMIPINGLLLVTNNVAKYVRQTEAQRIADGGADLGIITDIDDCFYGGGNGWAKTYDTMMTITGIKALSGAAFDYQTNIKLNDKSSTGLTEAVVDALPVYDDAMTFMNRMDEIDYNFELMTADDIEMTRDLVNGVLGYSIVKDVIGPSFDDLHNMLLTGLPFGDEVINYGYMTNMLDDMGVVGADKAEFEKGLSALFGALKTDTVGTIGGIVNNALDIVNFVYIAPNAQSDSLVTRLSSAGLMDMIAILSETENNTTKFAKLSEIILENPLFEIISTPDLEKLVINSKIIEGLGDSGWDTTLLKQDLSTIIGTTKGGQTAKQKWTQLFGIVNDSINVVATIKDAPDVINDYEQNGDIGRDEMLPKGDGVNAMLYYIKYDLTDETIGDFASALHDLAFSFDSIRKYIDDLALGFDVSEYSVYDSNNKAIVDVEEFKNGLIEGMFGEYDETTNKFITNPDEEDWFNRIKSIQQVAGSVLSFKNLDGGDIGGMLESLLESGSDLVDLIANDQVIADLVGGIIESQLETISENSPINIALPKIPGTDSYDGEAIAGVANIIGDMVDAADEAMNSGGAVDLSGMVEEQKDNLLSLAESGVVITLDDIGEEGESSLDLVENAINSLPDISLEDKNNLLKLFGLN